MRRARSLVSRPDRAAPSGKTFRRFKRCNKRVNVMLHSTSQKGNKSARLDPFVSPVFAWQLAQHSLTSWLPRCLSPSFSQPRGCRELPARTAKASFSRVAPRLFSCTLQHGELRTADLRPLSTLLPVPASTRHVAAGKSTAAGRKVAGNSRRPHTQRNRPRLSRAGALRRHSHRSRAEPHSEIGAVCTVPFWPIGTVSGVGAVVILSGSKQNESERSSPRKTAGEATATRDLTGGGGYQPDVPATSGSGCRGQEQKAREHAASTQTRKQQQQAPSQTGKTETRVSKATGTHSGIHLTRKPGTSTQPSHVVLER
jgi:hypothetical protein